MRKFILLLSLVNIWNVVLSHPGIGIVKDTEGNIYYTDLQHVWKIDKSGNKTVIVPNVHSHELYMDSADNLFGEHLWYNGERLNTWGHYVWCLRNDGSLVKIKGPSSGFLEDYSFVRDDEGNMYWAQRWKISRIFKKTKAGAIVTLAEGKFKDIRWMHATAGGTLYFIDLNDLYKIEKDGKLTLLAKNLEEKAEGSIDTSLKHNIFGIWTDKRQNIYIAVTGGKVVKRITSDGNVSIYYRTSGKWSPVGGLFDDGDNFWLMETNVLNEVRVRKISAKELAAIPVQKKSFFNHQVIITMLAVLVVTSLWLTSRYFLQRQSRSKTVL